MNEEYFVVIENNKATVRLMNSVSFDIDGFETSASFLGISIPQERCRTLVKLNEFSNVEKAIVYKVDDYQREKFHSFSFKEAIKIVNDFNLLKST
jgi:hypothetical protein